MNQPHIPENPASPAHEHSGLEARAEGIDAPRGDPASGAVVAETSSSTEVSLAVAKALFDSDAGLREIAAQVNQMSGGREAVIQQAMILVAAHFIGLEPLRWMATPFLATVPHEIATWMAELAANLKQIANTLAPLSGEVVDADRIASRLESTTSGTSQRAGRGASKWYGIEEAASLSGRSVSTIRRDIKAGTLPAHVIGRGRRRPSYRIRRTDLKAYIQAGRAEPPDPPAVPTTPVRKKSRHFD